MDWLSNVREKLNRNSSIEEAPSFFSEKPITGENHRSPTILPGVLIGIDIYGYEEFGPSVSLHFVGDDSEAVGQATDSQYARSHGTIYSRNMERALHIAKHLGTPPSCCHGRL